MNSAVELLQGRRNPPSDQAQSQLPPLSPDNLLYQQGLAAMQSYDYPQAVQLWQKALTLNPDHQEAKMGLQRVLHEMSLNTRLGRSTTTGYR